MAKCHSKVKTLRQKIMSELENALAPPPDDSSMYELPPLVVDGIPTPVEKMTQTQLRAFIPSMLKYSTGREKPGWDNDSTRPPWWPKDVPWSSVRIDVRSEDQKQKISWTNALRQIVLSCYKYHGRDDLLSAFMEEEEKSQVKTVKQMIRSDLENVLAQQAPPPPPDDTLLYELPPLFIDGITTPVEKMTQIQLRAFIPLMIKFSTGREKPGWGRDSTRPPWWPKDVPWANVRMDARSEDQKQKISCTTTLRQIVLSCYKYHGRDDLLPAFMEEDEQSQGVDIKEEHVFLEDGLSNFEHNDVCIKEENVLLEDGHSNVEHDNSFKSSPEIKKEGDENSDNSYTGSNQWPEFCRVDIKQEAEDSPTLDDTDLDEESLCVERSDENSEGNKGTGEDVPLPYHSTPSFSCSALNSKSICCPSCQYTSNKLNNLKKHLLIHSRNKQLQCEKCDYKCHWKSWMDRHERKHESSHETPYTCDRCDYQTRWKSCIERHSLKHSMLKPYSCLLCPYSATTKGDLRMHTMVHSETKRHKCKSCSYSTPRRQSLVIHVKNYHTDEGNPKRRGRDRRSTISINESEIRITTATGFRCPHCEYTCATKANIKRHIIHHFNKPEFLCDHCSYKSHRKDYLKSHMLTHSKIKAFQCSQCSFNCSWNSALRRHMLTHLDERPFQCNDCEFKSSDKSNLKRHVRAHLEIRLLLCSFCDVYFSAIENLVIHKKVNHKRDITGFLFCTKL